MISITVNVDEQSEKQVSALNQFLRNLNPGTGLGSTVEKLAPNAFAANQIAVEAGESYTSEESDFEREKIGLLRRFRAAGWKIPKDEIRALNKRVFKNVRKAAALYSEKAGYFKTQGNSYLATPKAREEFRKDSESERREVRKKLDLITKDGRRSASLPDPRDVDLCDPRLLKNRMTRAAMARDGFFSDLDADGVAKLEASMSPEERELALRWLEAVVAIHLDQFTTLGEYFDFFDSTRAYLDTAASIAGNPIQEAK